MSNPNVRGFFDDATSTWTYVVWGDGSKKCAIIDSVLDYNPAAGRTSTASADEVVSFVRSRGLEVEWILETHIHADHLTASHYLKEKLGGKIAISNHIVDVLKTWVPIFHTEADTPMDGSQFDHIFKDDEKFKIGDMEAQIIHTPGHTPADSTYLIGDTAFVGDALFLPDVGTGRCDFPDGSAEDSYNSTRKILALPDDTRVYVGHDYPDSSRRAPQCMAYVREEKSSNILANFKAAKDEFVRKRKESDAKKPVPELLLPSVQTNLRAGKVKDMKIPVNAL